MLTHLLLAAAMLPGFAGNVEDSGIALEVNTGHPVHIVRDETERPVFALRNTAGSDCELRGFLVLEDLFGHVLKLSVETNLTGGAECHVQGPWPLPAKGLWTVRGDLTDRNGKAIRPTTRFAFIDRHDLTPRLSADKFRMGFNYHRNWPSFSADDRAVADEALVACGAKIARVAFGRMGTVRRAADRPADWTSSDRMLEALHSKGVDVVAGVWGIARWAADANFVTNRTKVGRTAAETCPPHDTSAIEDHLAELSARYGTKIAYYEIGNEWDLRHFFPVGDIEDAIRAQRAGFAGIRRGCRNATLMPCGWACPGDSRPVELKGIQEAVMKRCKYAYDVHAIHMHGDYRSYRKRLVERFLPLRKKWGVDDVPWFASETACTSVNGREVAVAEFVWSKILLSWAYGSTDYIWYNLRAKGSDPADSEHGYGVLTADFHPRAAYAAFAALTSLLNGFEFESILRSEENHEVYRFHGQRDGLREVVLTAWEDIPGDDLRVLPVKTDATSAEEVDFMGNRKCLPNVDGRVIWSIGRTPRALRLVEATTAEPDPEALFFSRSVEQAIVVGDGEGRPADFAVNSAEFVDCPYDANPGTADRTWKGPSDCSFSAWVGRDATNRMLRLRVEVEDDVHSQPAREAKAMRAGDCLRVKLCKVGEYGEWSFGFCHADDGRDYHQVWGRPPACDVSQGDPLIEFGFSRDGSRSSYEMSFPEGALGLGDNPLDGSVRVALVVDDSDGKGRDLSIGVERPVILKKEAHK